MKIIPLTKGMVALIDDEDYDAVSQWSWYALFNGRAYYAASGERMPNGKMRHFLMHRLIMGATKGQLVDHWDRNTLDNRRENLRLATKSQNGMNQTLRTTSTSGAKGVGFLESKPDANKWRASIQANGKFKHLGYFPTKEEAVAAYDQAAAFYFGPYALTNSTINLRKSE